MAAYEFGYKLLSWYSKRGFNKYPSRLELRYIYIGEAAYNTSTQFTLNKHELKDCRRKQDATYPPDPIPPAPLMNALMSDVFKLPAPSCPTVMSMAPIACRVVNARRS